MKTYFTSDLHFGHQSVIDKFEFRPFSSVEEMDSELIRRWNNTVDKEDQVYVLGDMFWKRDPAYVQNILKRLHGKIVLIRGNHDQWLKNAGSKKLISEVRNYVDVVVTLNDGTKKRCILSHYFMPFYNSHMHGAIHLHGHSHNTAEAEEERKIAKYLNENGYQNEIYNVGCMNYDYTPVTLDEILAVSGSNK